MYVYVRSIDYLKSRSIGSCEGTLFLLTVHACLCSPSLTLRVLPISPTIGTVLARDLVHYTPSLASYIILWSYVADRRHLSFSLFFRFTFYFFLVNSSFTYNTKDIYDTYLSLSTCRNLRDMDRPLDFYI